MRKKKGSTANDPGAVTRANVAVPSSTVPIIARTTIRPATLRRSSVSSTGAAPRGYSPRRSQGPSVRCARCGDSSLLRELRDQIEDGHVHRDHDAADDDAKHGDHDGFEQRQQAGDGG